MLMWCDLYDNAAKRIFFQTTDSHSGIGISKDQNDYVYIYIYIYISLDPFEGKSQLLNLH